MVKYHRQIVIWWVFAALCGTVQAAVIDAKIDRHRIVKGETVTLVIQTNDPQLSLEGDFSPLEKDFQILDRRSETQMTIVNGKQSAVVRLLITLEPRDAGAITIPSLVFGADTTRPLSLTVDPAPEPEPGEAPIVFIEVEVEPREGPYYVHAQFSLTVRVFYQQSLTEAAISQPEPTPASVRLLDEVPFQADRGGHRYRVLERHYAIFPERSGPLQIPPMKLSGRLVQRRSDRLFQPSVRGRRIEVASDPVELLINPKPVNFDGDSWLPARSLNVSQTISASDALTVGEPITRTIIVDAVGLEENMITEPPWPEISDARIYPDQPQGISRNDGKWVLGHKEFRYAVVPEAEGELVLPELTLHWWDVLNDRPQKAVLPEKRLKVLPSTVVPIAAPVILPPVTPDRVDIDSTVVRGPVTRRYWTWLTFLFAALWLFTTALLIRRRKEKPARSQKNKTEMDPDEAGLLREVRKACEAKEPREVRRALSRWLRDFGPASAAGSLVEFAAQLEDTELAGHLMSLDALGFKIGDQDAWDGRGLWKALSRWRNQRKSKNKAQQLPVTDLYTDTRENARA